MADTAVPAPEEKTAVKPRAQEPNKRRRDAFILIGAALVLTAFIVKDAVREHLKDLSDAIDKAEIRYLESRDSSEMKQTLNLILNRISTKAGGEFDWTSVQQLLDQAVFFTRHRISNCWALVAEFPDNPGKSALAGSMVQINQAVDKLELSLFHHDALALMSSAGSYEHIRVDLLTFEQEALDLATKRKQAIEHRYNVSTTVSYVIYCVVLVFGVAAKLKGVDLVGE